MRALIGYSGFVGSNLLGQGAFEVRYNSTNFHELQGGVFDEIICAGLYAAKWIANQNPEQDKARINALESVLRQVACKRFILVSTIDVYSNPQDGDEATDLAGQPNHAYGRHRFDFEQFCRTRFSACHIIRLPGLFGNGLKKNVIYDLINRNCLENINPRSSFQYYDLARLQKDIDQVIRRNIPLMNLVTEPVATGDIHKRFFPDRQIGQNAAPAAHYNIKTSYAGLWGGGNGYIADAASVMARLGAFITTTQRAGSQ